MKHKIIYTTIMVLMIALTSSCKKDEDTTSPGGGASGPIPTSIVASWECPNGNLPTQALKDKYEKFTFDVSAGDAYSLKYHEKTGKITDFTGKVVIWDPAEKHTNGQAIMNININVEKINGQSFPGGWKGIYTFEAGNILKLNIEPNVSGIIGPTARNGFGSGTSGKDAVFHFIKK